MAPKNKISKANTAKSKDAQYAEARQDQLRALSQLIAANAGPTLREKVRLSTQAVLVLVLSSLSSPATSLPLTPVYGSVAAGLYHSQLVSVAFMLAWGARSFLQQWHHQFVHILPVIAFWIPVAQSVLLTQSGRFGAVTGPLVTHLATSFPLLVLAISVVAAPTGMLELKGPSMITDAARAAIGAVSYSLFLMLETTFRNMILRNMDKSLLLARIGLQYILAALFAVLAPSRLLLCAIPALLHAVTLNVHSPIPFTTARLQESLLSQTGFALIARQESSTGYISVLENTKDRFRVLRCDHSILGGEWIVPPRGFEHTSHNREPIYSVFTMMEAVRLVERNRERQTESALVVGLGIGTTAAALLAHGVETTVVEIDPVVYDFATRYFDLPSNHTAVIEDATIFVDREKAAIAPQTRYDYIIHDVFTGGAEPANLFTLEFISGLKDLLHPDGIIAINYAGDVLLPSARLVLRTISAVFPTCRMYREDEDQQIDQHQEAEHDSHSTVPRRDFTNVVVFCKKSSTRHLAFRQPTNEDFLGSHARRAYLLPKHELDVRAFAAKQAPDEIDVLTSQHVKTLEDGQRASALGHWEIMRTVLPDKVWEMW